MSLAHRLSPVVLGAMLVALPPARHPAAHGYTYDLTERSHTEDSHAGPGDVIDLSAHIRVDAQGNSRMDVVQASQSEMIRVGDYALMSGSKMLIVSPSIKQYVDVGDDPAAASEFESMRADGMKLTDGNFTFDSVPGRETIGERVTRHYRIVHGGTLSMTAPGMSITGTFSTATDYFIATDRVPITPTFLAPGGAAAGHSDIISPQMIARVVSVQGKMKGLPMRTVARNISRAQGPAELGGSTTSEVTIVREVTNLREVDVEPVSMTPPAGFTKVKLMRKGK